jgi:mRNA-degrading endonuclease RelE of RelBE toxin-antitoxin system
MNVNITATTAFERQLKRLCKKYPSLKQEMEALNRQLLDNPLLGTDIGSNLRKIRFAIASKGKGKSGGARVITHVDIIVQGDIYNLCSVIIYDKGEIESLSKSEILQILKQA